MATDIVARALALKNAGNLESGAGITALQMKQDGVSGTFSFKGKNPNAIEIADIPEEVPYGAIGNFSTALGGKSAAGGKRSLAHGTTTIAIGNYSHAEGDNSVAVGNDSHAEGFATTAVGTASHAEGNNTVAGGEISHAEGYLTKALAEGSHTEGNRTVSNHPYQTIVGMSNDNKEDTLFEVGNGSADGLTKSNAFQVHKDGHAEVKLQGETANSVTTKEYVDRKVASVISTIIYVGSELPADTYGADGDIYFQTL
jgi:hypothetical protein